MNSCQTGSNPVAFPNLLFTKNLGLTMPLSQGGIIASKNYDFLPGI